MAQTKKQTLTAQLLAFANYLSQTRGCSLPTRKNYHFYLKRFLKHSQTRQVNQITEEKIKSYKQWLAQQGLKRNTVNYHLIALRSFLNYLKGRKVKTLLPEKVRLGQQPRFQRAELTKAEMTRLLNAPSDAKEKEIIKLRDGAFLETLEAPGLMVSELVNLKTRDCQNRYERKNKI
ncbi:MAG: phage integrase N-terminal SAM-like domain-containing protein, partial [bacterium]